MRRESPGRHAHASKFVPDFSLPSFTARHLAQPPSSQCLLPAGVPWYRVEMSCLPLTRTAPFADERQVDRDFTTFATCMKYSSQDGRREPPFFKVRAT